MTDVSQEICAKALTASVGGPQALGAEGRDIGCFLARSKIDNCIVSFIDTKYEGNNIQPLQQHECKDKGLRYRVWKLRVWPKEKSEARAQ